MLFLDSKKPLSRLTHSLQGNKIKNQVVYTASQNNSPQDKKKVQDAVARLNKALDDFADFSTNNKPNCVLNFLNFEFNFTFSDANC